MPELVIELHVPLEPDPDVTEGDYKFPWIDDLTEAIEELVEDGEVDTYDDSEEVGDFYVWFLTGEDEPSVLAVAGNLATRSGVPSGVFAVVTDSDSTEVGTGRRVDIT